MTDFNPLAGSILGSTQAQHVVDVERQRNARRAQALSKNVAARDDEMEHQVESSEEVPAVNEQGQNSGQQRQPKDHRRKTDDDDGRPRIDVKA